METALSKVLSELQLNEEGEYAGEIFEKLTASIAELLEKEPDLLLSSLYRMDVNENKILAILNTFQDKDIPTALAILVLERQKVSLQTRAKFPQKKISDPEASF